MKTLKDLSSGVIRPMMASAVFVGALAAISCSSEAPLSTGVLIPVIDTTPVFIPATGTASKTPALRTAASYPMQYYISVPAGWPGNRVWPVVINLTGSSKDWIPSAELFGKVRDSNNYPFIVITPVTLTNGGDGPIARTHPKYQYPSAVWDMIDQQGRCAFDMSGIQAIVADVRNLYQGESKIFLTGWSAGGHPGWATVLLKPELLRAAALVGSDYAGRCVTIETFTPQTVSTSPSRVTLPIKHFNGSVDPFLSISIAPQATAMNLARANGYTNITTETIPGIGHDPMPTNVLAYFLSFLSASER